MSEDKFSVAWGFTGRAEGGWTKGAGDRGGETFKGIARVFHPKWEGWVKVDGMKGRGDFPACVNQDPELHVMVLKFFREEFWNAICGDALPLATAVAVFDQAVNFNPPPAIKELQGVLGVPADGVMGPNTIKAAAEQGFEAVVRLMARRNLRYFDDVKKYPDDVRWLPVWIERVTRLTVDVTRLDMGGAR